MKLFTKYNLINSWVTIIIFGIGSIAFYFLLHYILHSQLDETLRAEQLEIEGYASLYHKLPMIPNTRHQWVTYQKVTEPLSTKRKQTISVYNKAEDEFEPIRQLIFPINVDGINYAVTVNKSEVEFEDLMKLIIPVIVSMIGLVLLANFIINRRVVNRLLQPFYNTIDRIGSYHLNQQTPLKLPSEPIDEINLLNERLNKMTSRIYADYHSLKTFTENAAHEMQTPLAVIRSKIEILIQSADLNDSEMQQLLIIDNSAHKLSKLHQSLLLLTKLENRQFLLKEKVDLKAIIIQKVQETEEFILIKKLVLETDLAEVQIPFHPQLAEIMISNLINNAIRYTDNEGTIRIKLSKTCLVISNNSNRGPLNEHHIFQRFYKENAHGGTGLGLAIVKEICLIAGFKLSYKYSDNQEHIFTINLI
ncbi:sensor histidine kinase [Solitalea lacus]|uniref:sensor histidine kinase n=1 Tax=Solitalea lacus TaxID=2911172 RepID=UPI001EDBA0B8|nr:HAMP domain-containing sensor histidine kinase [Solitalea lacus]UKJ08547.1 HAMP domain-containing histidine kinase [Solitalea lacus]